MMSTRLTCDKFMCDCAGQMFNMLSVLECSTWLSLMLVDLVLFSWLKSCVLCS